VLFARRAAAILPGYRADSALGRRAGYWQASHSPPVRIASIERLTASTRGSPTGGAAAIPKCSGVVERALAVASSMLDAPSVRR